MKALIQRVKKAEVSVNKKIIGKINHGLLVFLGVHKNDTENNVKKLTKKISNLRIFSDKNDKMNLSIKDTNGEILIISQFTLYGECKKGNRPSFIESAPPELAKNLYKNFINHLKKENIKIETGKFRANMQIDSINDGPISLIIEI